MAPAVWDAVSVSADSAYCSGHNRAVLRPASQMVPMIRDANEWRGGWFRRWCLWFGTLRIMGMRVVGPFRTVRYTDSGLAP